MISVIQAASATCSDDYRASFAANFMESLLAYLQALENQSDIINLMCATGLSYMNAKKRVEDSAASPV